MILLPVMDALMWGDPRLCQALWRNVPIIVIYPLATREPPR